MADVIQRLGVAAVDAAQRAKLAHSDLAAIERGTVELPEGAAQHEAEDARITVFLMPGIHYDKLARLRSITANHMLDLARLRYALRDQIRFVLIAYPDWREMVAAKADFDIIVTSALRQILGQCGDGPIYLVGYSFGGFVAFATAHRLVESGQRVAFLGLLDSRRSELEGSPLTTAAKSMREYFRRPDVALLLRLILRILLVLRAFVLLEFFPRLCMSVGGGRIGPQLIYVLRSYALRRWRANALSIPTVLFRSGDNQPNQPDDGGWSALCSTFRVVPIGGDHSSMLSPPHATRLCVSFLEALRAADASSGFHSSTDRVSSNSVE